jgi:hypothetical protein
MLLRIQGAGSAFPLQIRIQESQINADLCGSGSTTMIRTEKYYLFKRRIF